MRARYGDQGLVLIGIHTTDGGESMAEFVKAKGIDYPVAIDVENRTKRAFKVDSYPDYYLIDRAGVLRYADLANADLEKAVQGLIAEPPPYVSPVPAALKRAKKKDKRVLVLWGHSEARAATDARLKGDLRTLATNEFEVLRLTRAQEPELAARWKAGESGFAATVLSADGTVIGRMGTAGSSGKELHKFLTAHRVPQKNATALWKAAKERAQAEKKNILVHLGAPW